MPIYKTITVDENTNVLIWKIEESYEVLCNEIELTQYSKDRISNMKSDIHRRGFMSVRHLLKTQGYSDCDLYYDELGKPHLKDEKYISITHSFEYAGIIISNHPVGIDIEKQRDKIHKIARKFISPEENHYLKADILDLTRALTVIWGAKESLYKLYATAGLSFKQHIYISAFVLENPFLYGRILYKNKSTDYDLTFIEFEGFTCVYALPSL